MIALHTVDMWQSVRCYPNVPGNRLSRQRAGPSAEGPFLRRGALPLCRVLPDTLAIPRPLSLQRGIPRQLVLVKNYRRIFARPSRENMAVSFRKIREKIGILYKILCPARCRQALGGFFLGRTLPAGAGTESPAQEVRHLIWRHKETDSQTASLFHGEPKGIRILDLSDAKSHLNIFRMISNYLLRFPLRFAFFPPLFSTLNSM